MKLNSRSGKERVFGPQLPRTGFWQVTLPLSVIHGYRRIPCKVRGAWSMGSSTSHLAETAVAAGGGWASFRRYSSGWKFLPAYAVGAGLRHAGVTRLLLRSADTDGRLKVPPLPPRSYSDIMGQPVNHWDGKPVTAGFWSDNWGSLRGEPFTSPWYGRSSAQVSVLDPDKAVDWFQGQSRSGRISYTQLLDRGRRGWGGDKPRPVWRISLGPVGWGADDVWKKVTRADVIDRGWLADYAAVRSEGWGDPFKHVSMEHKELPDWFPSTRAAMPDGIPGWIAGHMGGGWFKSTPQWRPNNRIGTDWDTPRNAIRFFLLGGLLAGLFGPKAEAGLPVDPKVPWDKG